MPRLSPFLMCMCVHLCLCRVIREPTNLNARSHTSTFVIWGPSLDQTRELDWATWPASPRDLPVYASPVLCTWGLGIRLRFLRLSNRRFPNSAICPDSCVWFFGDWLSVCSDIEKILGGRAEANVVGSPLCSAEVRGSYQMFFGLNGLSGLFFAFSLESGEINSITRFLDVLCLSECLSSKLWKSCQFLKHR